MSRHRPSKVLPVQLHRPGGQNLRPTFEWLVNSGSESGGDAVPAPADAGPSVGHNPVIARPAGAPLGSGQPFPDAARGAASAAF